MTNQSRSEDHPPRLRHSCVAAPLAWHVFVLTACVAFAVRSAQAEPESLRQKQQAQEQARALAGELVSGVLDLQLQQLAENGLQDLPIYRDIASMKEGLGELASGRMEAVVRMLIDAQDAPANLRQAKLDEARELVRETVVRLLAERQKLDRRMKISRLAADVKQLLDLQTKAERTTRSLSERPQEERERLALRVIQDQADAHRLFGQLTAALQDVSAWGGPVAAAAADGLRIVRAGQVEPELERVQHSLGRADFLSAAKSQQAAIQGLKALLQRLEEAQGIADGDREAALRFVRELIQQQQLLREHTKIAEFSERSVEPLIERQTALQKELGRLADGLARFTLTLPLQEAAKAASFEATANLFEEKKPPALEQQNRVLQNLAQIAKLLEQQTKDHSSLTAAELAALVHKLTALGQRVAALENEQQAIAGLPKDSADAAPRQQKVTDNLARETAGEEWSEAIQASLRTAHEAASQSPAAAQLALQQAGAEIASELADAIRRQRAVELGELARASEALERAAAAEREISRLTAQVAGGQTLAATRAIAMLTEQQDIAQVAAKIAAGVAAAAPSAAEMLAQTRVPIASTLAHLQALERNVENPDAQVAQNASDGAGQIATQLLAAAAELRTRAGLVAKDLEKIAGEQFAQAQAAEQAIARAARDAASDLPESIANLQKAQQALRAAQIAQSQAEGKTEQSLARQLEENIADLIARQRLADSAAQDLARGKSNSPLKAASLQQDVADGAAEVARQAVPSAAPALASAESHARQAARETLSGQPARAQVARDQTRSALESALKAAQQNVAAAVGHKPGPLDSAAQARTADFAKAARELLQTSSKNPALQPILRSLENLSAESRAAQSQINAQNAAAAQAMQQSLQDRLASALQSAETALNELSQQQAASLAKQSLATQNLQEQAAAVDPGAAAALQQAAAAAQRGADAGTGADQAAAAQQQMQDALQQAEANLAIRALALRRDRDLAFSLAGLAQSQQAARDTIAKAAADLESPAATAASKTAAARALQTAQQQFADAQRSTGEGAATVSGQPEVANVPIREALQIASQLNQLLRSLTGAAQQLTTDPSAQDAAHAAATQSSAAQSAAQSTAASGQPPPSDAGKPGTNQQGNSNPAAGQQPGAPPAPSQLGTGLVPASPESTAQQIAGAAANAAAAKAMAAGQASNSASEGQSDQPGQGESAEGSPSSMSKKGGAVKSGKAAQNKTQETNDADSPQNVKPGERGELANQDAVGTGQRLENEPWFARLPPTLRSAIQAKARGKAPRGYEERLKRYFESVD